MWRPRAARHIFGGVGSIGVPLMVKQMGIVAAECFKHPTRSSVWLPAEGRYVCPESDEALKHAEGLAAQQANRVRPRSTQVPRRLNPEFKLVFLTAAGGTGLFTILCIALSIYVGKDPPPLLEKLISNMFDLVKIGFGAVVGLLGAKSLQAREESAKASA
jgi:hypothetical protein